MTFGPLLLLPNETELMSYGSFVVAVLVQLLPCPLFINLTEPSNKKNYLLVLLCSIVVKLLPKSSRSSRMLFSHCCLFAVCQFKFSTFKAEDERKAEMRRKKYIYEKNDSTLTRC